MANKHKTTPKQAGNMPQADWPGRLRRAIDASGETRYVICQRAGLSKNQNLLARFMRGKGISLATAGKLAAAIDVELIQAGKILP